LFNRRQPNIYERMTPCEICGYPLTHRHHLLPVSKYGENEETMQLCANCHQVYHIAYDVLTRGSERCSTLFRYLYTSEKVNKEQIDKIVYKCFSAIVRHKASGVLPDEVITGRFFQAMLGTEYTMAEMDKDDMPKSIRAFCLAMSVTEMTLRDYLLDR